MRKSFSLIIMAFFMLTSTGIYAQGLLKPDYPETYVVKEGDTLWDLAEKYLNSPWLWPEIWHINPQVANPHLIYPGDELQLIYIDGKPKLTIKRGTTPAKTVKYTPKVQPQKQQNQQNQVADTHPTVKLSPRIRVKSYDNAIQTIPLEKINTFLTNSRVVSEVELERSHYVVAGMDGHLLLSANEKIYARGKWQDNASNYGVFRIGNKYIDPESNELLGFEAESIGSGVVLAVDRDIATIQLNQTNQNVRATDRVLPTLEKRINSRFTPRAPAEDTNGYIIDVLSGNTQVGKYGVVVINKGERNNVTPGHVFAIYSQGRVVRDRVAREKVKLPEEYAGLLMVFRTFEKVSYGLVLSSNKGVFSGFLIKTP